MKGLLMNNPVVFAFLAAFGFAAWPLMLRGANLSGIWVAILATIGAVPIVLLGYKLDPNVPAFKSILWGLLAGVINGFAMLAYSRLVAWKGVDLSSIMPLVLVITPLVIVLGGFFIYGEQIFAAKKLAGIVFALLAIWFLS